MSNQLQRRGAGQYIGWRTIKALREVAASAQVEQGTIRAITAVSEYAIWEVDYLKRVQNQVEHGNPDAADAVAGIVSLTAASIARRVGRYANGVDW